MTLASSSTASVIFAKSPGESRLVEDRKLLERSFNQIEFKYIWSEANFAADVIAKADYISSVAGWSSMFSPLVNRAAKFDILGIGYNRGDTL